LVCVPEIRAPFLLTQRALPAKISATMANWAGPEISDEDSARSAAHMAGGWAAVVAGLTAVLSIISIAGSVSLMGASPMGLIDAALFGIVAWRVWNGSRAWAVTGLVLYCLEIIFNVISRPPGVGILTFIILLALINGVRGTFGLHKYVEMNKAQIQAQPAAPGAAMGSYMPTSSTPPPPPPPPPSPTQ
jgi:hypothetical protein